MMQNNEEFFDYPGPFEDFIWFDLDDDNWQDCFLSQEEFNKFNAPSHETWVDLSPEFNATTFTLDDAKDKQWTLAKKEIMHLKKRIQHMVGPAGNNITQKDIITMSLGVNSPIGEFMQKELNLSSKEYCEFMGTLCLQCAYRVSATELFQNDSLLKDKAPMAEDAYNAVWKTLATKKQVPSNSIRTTRCEAPLWETLESIVNKYLHEVSISSREGTISLALDDDKIWFGSSKAKTSDLFNLKFTTHVKPNRKGIVAHTAVSTGAIIPLGIVFERTKDTTSSCMCRLLDSIFGRNGSTDLQNVNIHSDRGYMIPTIVFDYLLRNGAHVVGTIKRMAQCWPFTYNQQLSESDKRTLIDVRGAATLFLKWCKSGGRRLFACAFRNGSQSVATAVSSIHQAHHWEGVVYKQSEKADYDRDKSCLVGKFFLKLDLNKINEDEEDQIILDDLLNEIDPLTLRQGTADWHYLRKFSLTSSQAHGAFLKALPAYKNDASWVEVAKYMYGSNWIADLNLLDHESDEGHIEENAVTNLSPPNLLEHLIRFGEDNLVAQMNVVEQRALNFLRDAVQNEEGPYTLEDAKESFSHLSNSEKLAVRKILETYNPHDLEMKANLTNTDVLKWLQQPNVVREVMFYKGASLKKIMQRKGITFSQRSGAVTNERMIGAISGINTNEVEDVVTESTGRQEQNPKESVIHIVLQKSFLPHQKGDKREHCSLGHRLEVPILKSFINIIPEVHEYRGVEVKNAYKVGLAGKKGERYAKDSLDFVLSVFDPKVNRRTSWGFEAKGRVTVGTATDEAENLVLNLNPHLRIQDCEVFERVRKDDERFQVLQHAYVYNFDTVVLAISDSQSELIRSYVIDFTTQLKYHFRLVLQELKNLGLYWAYQDDENYMHQNSSRNKVLNIPDEVLKIASNIPTINGKEALQGTANLWYSMSQLPKPFPSCIRIIPAICAYWNSVKGGSDTTTKLMDDCLLQIPKIHMNSETVAISRSLMIMQVLNHRLMQVLSSRDDLNYPSLYHWRHAASERTTFHSSLLKHYTFFMKELEKNAIPCPDIGSNSSTPTQSEPRRSARRCAVDGAIPESIDFAYQLQMKTPAKLSSTIQNGTAKSEILNMAYKCTGQPIQLYPSKADRLCGYCHGNTSWYCVGCKQWLCMSRRATASNKKSLELYHHKVRGKELNFQKACYHKFHEDAWLRLASTPADSVGVNYIVSSSSSDS